MKIRLYSKNETQTFNLFYEKLKGAIGPVNRMNNPFGNVLVPAVSFVLDNM